MSNELYKSTNIAAEEGIKKLERISAAAEVIVQDYWKYVSEDSAKKELKDAVYDYKGWVKINDFGISTGEK